MKIDILKPIIALAAIVFLVLYLVECGGRKTDGLNYASRISQMDLQLKTLRDSQALNGFIIDSLRVSRETSYKQTLKSDSLYRLEKKRLSRSIKENQELRAVLGIKPDTITLRIEGDYQARTHADSVQISKLEARIFNDSASFEAEIKLLRENWDKEVKISGQWREFAVKETHKSEKFKGQRNTAIWAVVLETLLLLALIVL